MSEYTNYQATANEYSVDLVICIDGTGSMMSLIDTVKQQAKDFYNLYVAEMYKSTPPRAVRDNGLRVKVIVFRDFVDTKTAPLEQSRFFNLQDPAEVHAFQNYVDNITAEGGGDTPENALEAIVTAMQTEWSHEGGGKRRQVILLFTDTCTYDLNVPSRASMPGYPSMMPHSVEELQDIWESGDQELVPDYAPKFGRLIVFAPLDSGVTSPADRIIDWKYIDSWPRTWLVNVKPGGGCDEVDMQQALNVLVGSY